MTASPEALRSAVADTEAAFRSLQADSPVWRQRVEAVVDGLLGELKASDTLLVPLLSGWGGARGPARTAADVAILSLRIGMELRDAPHELHGLGLAALLHDVAHNGTIAARLRAAGPVYAEVAAIVARAQEAIDGRGTPGRGGRVQKESEIVALAALYETLSRQQPTGPRPWPPVAVKEILQRGRARFADDVLKALIHITVAFPVGGLVRLNSGEVGCVVSRNDGLPLRPVVSIHARRGRPLPEPKVIDLRESPFLYVREFLGHEAPEHDAEEISS
jgi:hypothetical protein